MIQQQNTLMQLLVQNQGNNNNNPPPPPVDNLARFLRLQPPVFSSSTEPIVADDWLRKIGRELTIAGCTNAERVCFAAHQLDGLAGYYRRFIGNFSKIAKPMTELLKKDTKFKWTKECEASFQELK